MRIKFHKYFKNKNDNIKTKLEKSDDLTNIDKYRVAANIKEYHIISKLIFPRIIIPKLLMLRQLFTVKNVCKYVKINTDNDVRTFWSEL